MAANQPSWSMLLLVSLLAGCSGDGVASEESTAEPVAEPEETARGPRAEPHEDAGRSASRTPNARDGAVAQGPGARPDGAASAPLDGSAADAAEDPAPDGRSARDAGDARDVSGPDAPRDAAPADATSGEQGRSADCPSSALRGGDTRATLMHGGQTRSFIIHVPTGYDNTRPLPLVLNFHGATMTAALQQQTSRMNDKADQAGFVVIYPDGVERSWNAGACCGGAASSDVDDVGFARALVTYASGRVCIDAKRVYAAGFSNGGRMSYRLGCEAADVFAAIAPVAGTKSFPDLDNSPGCMPARPISLIDFMGSRDSRIAAQPGQIAEWRKFNGCTDAEAKETYREGRHVCYSYEQCAAGTSVTYCVVDGLGHAWPTGDFSANDHIWALFQRSRL